MDGARVQKKSGGKPGPAVWVPAAILAVLLAAYLGLCGWVSASDTILPNVTAAGLDLSGMTQAEAEQAINENLSVAQQAGSGWAVGLSCDGYIGTLDGSSFQVDAASLARRPCLWDAAASSPGGPSTCATCSALPRTLVPIRSN